MIFYGEDSWKKKIDPAFDKPVKRWIKHLSEIEELPDDWQVKFQKKFTGLLSDSPNLLTDYNTVLKKEELQFIINVGLATKHQGEVLTNSLSAIVEYNTFLMQIVKNRSMIAISQLPMLPKIISQMHSLMKLAKELPEEESRQYYINKINVFIKDISTKPFTLFQKDFISILLSIFLRLSDNKVDEFNKKFVLKEDIEHFMSSLLVCRMVGSTNSIISQLFQKKDMSGLLESMKKGDVKSLIKAINVDKTLIFSEFATNSVFQAQASGNQGFTTKLANAIEKRPLVKVAKYGKTYAVLERFWYTELYKLNYQELYFFLKSCGLKVHKNQAAFDRFMLRNIKINKIF